MNSLELVKFLINRHILISYAYPKFIDAVAAYSSTFVLDNGAFTIWRKGGKLNVDQYIQWVYQWYKHPGFEWCVIPDIIEGKESDNDALIKSFPADITAVPVYHLYESLDKIDWLSQTYRVVCIASNGIKYRKMGNKDWWERIAQVMSVICDEEGRPRCKLHGLRLMNPRLFTHIPLASADSSNAVQNRNTLKRFGQYPPPTESQRAMVIADRIERYNSASCWKIETVPYLKHLVKLMLPHLNDRYSEQFKSYN